MSRPPRFRFVDRIAVSVLIAACGVAGCGGPQATVSGRITCQGKPVTGVVLFSTKGENDASRIHEAVSAPLSPTGDYTLKLHGTGKYVVVVTPSDVVLRPKPGTPSYPCDRSPRDCDIVAGSNDVSIELSNKGP